MRKNGLERSANASGDYGRCGCASIANDWRKGDGFKIAMMGLDGGRLNIAACSLGGAQSALEQSIDYVKERKQFNQTLGAMQNTQFKLDMEVDLQSSRLMLYTAAQSLMKTPDATPWCAMANGWSQINVLMWPIRGSAIAWRVWLI